MNLRNSFPEKTPEELKLISKKYYRFLSDMLLESLKMMNISEQQIRRRFRINNQEEVEQYLGAGQAVTAVTGHYGNWEWGSLILSAMVKYPALITYKPLSNKEFECILNGMRGKFGAILVPMKGTLRKVIGMRGKSFLSVLVGDQTPSGEEVTYFTEFLNQPTAVFLGIEKIAKISNGPVVFCHINRYKRGHYECNFTTLFKDPKETAEKEITNAHTRFLEEIIRKKPELWLWSHKRWKHKPENFPEHS